MSKPCDAYLLNDELREVKEASLSLPAGSITLFNLSEFPEGKIPDGWKVMRWLACQLEWPDGCEDCEAAQNPYQPDIARIVMLEKL